MLNEKDFEFDIGENESDFEHVPAEIVSDPDEFEKMTLSVQKKNQEALANMKKKLAFSLDNRKLKEAENIISSLEHIGELFSDSEVIERVRENTKSAMDMKFLAEAYAKLLDSQQKLMRLDSIDGSGTAKRLNIAVEFQNGTPIKTVIGVDEHDG